MARYVSAERTYDCDCGVRVAARECPGRTFNSDKAMAYVYCPNCSTLLNMISAEDAEDNHILND